MAECGRRYRFALLNSKQNLPNKITMTKYTKKVGLQTKYSGENPPKMSKQKLLNNPIQPQRNKKRVGACG